jgi:AhpD family alkylhydroperoxidase
MASVAAPTSATSPSMLSIAATGDKYTRKSIKKYFPLGPIMSQGQNNPITLHSVVNETAFACLWSFMAEVMVVENVLPRSIKEAVALLVSEKNACPMCCSAHRMMGVAAKHAEKSKRVTQEEKKNYEEMYLQSMDYAEALILDTLTLHSTDASKNADTVPDHGYGHLNDEAKTEIALVVLLFCHMNRIISAVLGETMSTAMFSVPKGAAKRIEAPKVMKLANKLMAPFLAGSMKTKREAGLTAPLFKKGSSSLNMLPPHLRGAQLAGDERANALERLVLWSQLYEEYLMGEGIVTSEVIELLDNLPPGLMPSKVAYWATTDMKKLIRACLRKDERAQDIANILTLVTYSPQSVYHSIHWQEMVNALGAEQAKALVVWWSLRSSIKRAQGLAATKEGRHDTNTSVTL